MGASGFECLVYLKVDISQISEALHEVGYAVSYAKLKRFQRNLLEFGGQESVKREVKFIELISHDAKNHASGRFWFHTPT